MTIKKNIVQIVLLKLKPLGFDFVEDGHGDWSIGRVSNETKERIDITKSSYGKKLMVYLHSSKRFESIDLKSFLYEITQVPPDFSKMMPEDWDELSKKQAWCYEDEITLKDQLELILDTIFKYGFEWFEAVARDKMEPPNECIEKSIFENNEKKSKEFVEKYQIDVVKGEEYCISEIERILTDAKQQDTEVDWDFFVIITSFYGNTMRRAFGGKWEWKEQWKETHIIREEDDQFGGYHPLHEIIQFYYENEIIKISLVKMFNDYKAFIAFDAKEF